MKMKIGLPMEHQRRRNDAIVGGHHLNNHQMVGHVVLKVVTAVAREAPGILFRMRTLRIVKMKVRGWNQLVYIISRGCCRKMAKY